MHEFNFYSLLEQKVPQKYGLLEINYMMVMYTYVVLKALHLCGF